MNLLSLTQRLATEVGSTANITTTVGLTGENARLLNWIQTAWMDIQAEHQDWDWMRTSTSFTTVSGTATYSIATIGLTDFGMWAKGTFRNYVTATGTASEIFMDYIDYDDWRNSYQYGSLRTSLSRPQQFTITPDKSIGLGPVPEGGYTITGDYFTVPAELAADASIPALPVQHHMMIVYRAMMSYGNFNAAPEVYQRGEIEYRRMMSRVAIDRLPAIALAGALA